jgi:hypothetical protein
LRRIGHVGPSNSFCFFISRHAPSTVPGSPACHPSPTLHGDDVHLLGGPADLGKLKGVDSSLAREPCIRIPHSSFILKVQDTPPVLLNSQVSSYEKHIIQCRSFSICCPPVCHHLGPSARFKLLHLHSPSLTPSAYPCRLPALPMSTHPTSTRDGVHKDPPSSSGLCVRSYIVLRVAKSGSAAVAVAAGDVTVDAMAGGGSP